jgi:RND family efflux transporter MFP subunit
MLLCVAIAGCCGCGSGKEATGTPKKEAPVQVEAVTAVRGDIVSYIRATGTVCPEQEAFVSPEIGGRIEKLFADEGDRITRGQPIIQLEQTKLVMAQNEAAAALNTFRAELRMAELSLANLKKNLKRIRELHRQGVIDDQKYDAAGTEYLSAEAQLQLSAARVTQAEAQLAQAQQNLADSTVYAPFSGFVVKKMMNEGEMVYTMSPAKVLHLTDISRVKIECEIAEAKKQYVHMGKTAQIEVDAFPGERFSGTVTTINPLVDPSSRTFKIKIELPNPDFRFESGMFARIKIVEQERKNTVLVPLKSVVERGGKKVLFIVEKNSARMIPVELGISDHTTIEVRSGLRGGELVVSEGFYAINNGSNVSCTSTRP